LALADHVHQLNASEHGASGSERFKVEDRPGHRLNGTMILFDNVVEVFDLRIRIGTARPSLIESIAALLVPL
jgi:hypothetical protein